MNAALLRGKPVLSPHDSAGYESAANMKAMREAQEAATAAEVKAVAKYQRVYAFGYPAAAPYDGGNLWGCSSDVMPTWDYGTISSDRLRSGCDFTFGASGGPWLLYYNGSWGYLNGVTSAVNVPLSLKGGAMIRKLLARGPRKIKRAGQRGEPAETD